MKINFLRLFIVVLKRNLSKEEQNREFKLRQARNDLSTKFKTNKYRVGSGKLQCQSDGRNEIDACDVVPSIETSIAPIYKNGS